MTGTPRVIRNPLALAVLAYLAERPMHPYELGKLLKQRDQHESIKYRHASLYMVVDQLARAGYIAEQETVRETRRPERTVYALTAAGTARLHTWMRELLATPAKEYRQFEAALALIAALPPEDVIELLVQRQESLTEQADRIRAGIHSAVGAGTDQLFLIEDEYRLTLIEAEQTFIQRLREQIRLPDFGKSWRELHTGPKPALRS